MVEVSANLQIDLTLAVCAVREVALSCGPHAAGGGIRSNPESVTSELELAALQLRSLVAE